MSITISNLRIIPYGQKDSIKPVFGDTMHLTFRLADAPQEGDRYLLGLDYERILFPTMRPLCAYTEDYTADQNDISFDLAINTERFALWASTLKKPTPIWLQLVRVRGEEYTTILLDDILALPSVVDGANMVFPGTPLEDILENKADLVGGKVPLSQLPPIGFEQVQSDWDESDSSEPSYIRNKPEIGEAKWGSITGDLSAQTDLADALDGKANLVGGKVSASELPVATTNSPGLVQPSSNNGISVSATGGIWINSATDTDINARTSNYKPITPNHLDYAVRSVLPNVTTIPSVTTAYSLLDASATTNNHSWQYFHAPASASNYVFPAVTNTAVAHRIKLTIDFTDVQTYSFEDSEGNTIAPLFTPTITAGDVYEFDCEYSAVKGQWLIWPHKQGSVSDDYVMQSQVGAANGVAGLDSSGLVSSVQLPAADSVTLGAVKVPTNAATIRGITISTVDKFLGINKASDANIDERTTSNPIVPSNLNYAVAAALTDANKIQLTDAQKASAQDTLGIAAPIIGTTAPTTSTVGSVGQLYVDTATSKTYHCTAKTNTGTEQEPVYSYTWTDDINEKGGTFTGEVTASSALKSKNIFSGSYPKTLPAHIDSSICAGFPAQIGDFTFNYGISYGANNVPLAPNSLVGGKWNLISYTDLCTIGNGIGYGDRHNAEELDPNGNLYIAGGYQQEIHTIPSATTSYMLADGVYQHFPSAASTYLLPDPAVKYVRLSGTYQHWAAYDSYDSTNQCYKWRIYEEGNNCPWMYSSMRNPGIGDNLYNNTALTQGAKAITAIDNRAHECILTVRFSSSVLTYAFEDAAGNTLTPLPLAGTISDGSVVAFRCTWEALLNSWVIMPVMLGTYAEVEP